MAFWVKLTAAMPDMWSSKRAETVGAPTLFASAVAPREGACKNGFAARACASYNSTNGASSTSLRRSFPATGITSPLAVTMVSPLSAASSTSTPSSDSPEAAASDGCSSRTSTIRSTSSTMSRRLLIKRSSPEVSTVVFTGAAGVGARLAATLGTLPMLLSRAFVGPGEMVHASSSPSSPSSGRGTCSMAMFAIILSRSSVSDASSSRSLSALPPNGHAMIFPPPRGVLSNTTLGRYQTTFDPVAVS